MKKIAGCLIFGSLLIYGYQAYAQNSTVPGDINGDNALTLADAVLGLQVLVFSDIQYEINLKADIGDDKKIGLKEVIYILQKISSTYSPSCIADLNNWKRAFQPHNSDCISCHRTCTPNRRHTFCSEGEPWGRTESTCLTCHSSVHR